MDSYTFLKQFDLNEEDTQLMQSLGEEQSFSYGEEIPSYDKTANHFYFVKSGFIRSYRLIDGDDFTYTFFLEGDICVDYESILRNKPSTHFFEVLAPTETIKYNFSEIEALFDKHPRIERIARKMAEFAYVNLLNRVREFQSDSLEKRYLNLIENNEEVFQAAPLKHIASYLGVKPQSLSRIRAKIKKEI